jgi:hypothetical protein
MLAVDLYIFRFHPQNYLSAGYFFIYDDDWKEINDELNALNNSLSALTLDDNSYL